MSDGDPPGGPTGATVSGAAADRPRSYNLPQRYPVPPPEPAPRRRSTDLTEPNPALAQPLAPPPAQPARQPVAFPIEHGAPGQLDGYPPAGRTPRRPGNRPLLIATVVAVVAIAALLGLYLGLSDDSSDGQGAAATALPSVSPPSVTASASSAVASPTSAAAQICQALSRTAPLDTLIELPHAATSMPASFLAPTDGRNTAVCVARFTAGGQAHGDVAYVAEYATLAASRYATQLKQAGWRLVSDTSAPTYQDDTTDKVTLVQQGTALVMLLDTGP